MKIILRYGTGEQNKKAYGLMCQTCGCRFVFDESEIIARSRGCSDAVVECPHCKAKLKFDTNDAYMKESLC